MGLPQQTSTNPTEKPSTSETFEQSNTSAETSTQSSSIGATDPSQLVGGAMSGGSHGSAEAAADKLYEERIEEEYAKREGGA